MKQVVVEVGAHDLEMIVKIAKIAKNVNSNISSIPEAAKKEINDAVERCELVLSFLKNQG